MKLILLSIFLTSNLFAGEDRTIHVEGPKSSRGMWTEFTSSTDENLRKLMELLEKSPTGARLLKEAAYKASRSGQSLKDVIKVGEGSLTDTTLVRKFSPHSPENVVYETRSVVYINRHLNWDDALLDLAHELTHFVFREGFNPYSDSFNPKDFIKSTIEGTGGEVQAFMTECRVLKELFSNNLQSRSHCTKIHENGQLSYSKAVDLFYHVGDYYESFGQQLQKRSIAGEFSQLASKKINFISSAYGVPYPVAALMEYDLVINKVCENDKKRLAYMQQGPKRGPASVSNEKAKFLNNYTLRCSSK